MSSTIILVSAFTKSTPKNQYSAYSYSKIPNSFPQQHASWPIVPAVENHANRRQVDRIDGRQGVDLSMFGNTNRFYCRNLASTSGTP